MKTNMKNNGWCNPISLAIASVSTLLALLLFYMNAITLSLMVCIIVVQYYYLHLSG